MGSEFEVVLADRVGHAVSRWAPGAVVDAVAPLPGGASSLTFLATVSGGPAQRVVVKVAPPGLEPVRNRDVLRQARIFSVLAGAEGVATPTVLATDIGDPPETPPLFVMSYVEGDSVEPYTEPDPAKLPGEAVVAARASAAAAMLAALHEVSPRRPELRDERSWSAEDEVRRWTKTFASLDDDLRPAAAAECQRRLLAHLPAPVDPVVVHGDWRLGNMLCRGSEIGAVIDWEIWGLGDPRVDLAWFMLMADPARTQNVRADCGMPSPDELAGAYESAAGRTVANLDWWSALVRYKQAAAAAFITKNNRRLANPDPTAERHGAHSEALLQAAIGYLPAA